MSDAGLVHSMKDRADLEALEAKIREILPPQYQTCYEYVSPTSMGSAPLAFDSNGNVAWDHVWTSYCHLALAGGPPHRGTLLEAVPAASVAEDRDEYVRAAEEIGRGIRMVTGLDVIPQASPGWVGVRCSSEVMADWLVRAIIVENVSARREHNILYVPAGPRFRLYKEIKNVVTATAKTCHYWTDHMGYNERAAHLAKTFSPGAANETLLEPATPEEALAAGAAYQSVVDAIQRRIKFRARLPTIPSPRIGWVGVGCSDERMAIWLTRALIVEDVLARREGGVLYLPANPRWAKKLEIRRLVSALARACRCWTVRLASSPLAEGGSQEPPKPGFVDAQ